MCAEEGLGGLGGAHLTLNRCVYTGLFLFYFFGRGRLFIVERVVSGCISSVSHHFLKINVDLLSASSFRGWWVGGGVCGSRLADLTKLFGGLLIWGVTARNLK